MGYLLEIQIHLQKKTAFHLLMTFSDKIPRMSIKVTLGLRGLPICFLIIKAPQNHLMLIFFLTTKNAQGLVIFVNPILRQPILNQIACILLTAWDGILKNRFL
jgi:hypothetical protein